MKYILLIGMILPAYCLNAQTTQNLKNLEDRLEKIESSFDRFDESYKEKIKKVQDSLGHVVDSLLRALTNLKQQQQSSAANSVTGFKQVNKTLDSINTFTGVPVGTIVAFAGTGSLPAGWLLCDGKNLSKTGFTELYKAIGNTWGESGNTFKLPDLQGLFLRGAGGGERNPEAMTFSNPAGIAGEVGSIQNDATKMPGNVLKTAKDGTHSHTIEYSGSANMWTQDPHGNFDPRYVPINITGTAGIIDKKELSRGIIGGDHAHTIIGGDRETRPKSALVNYIIKIRSENAKPQ